MPTTHNTDKEVRARVNDVPVYEFESTPFTQPPELAKARVAIVTTAGLRTEGNAHWQPGDQSFSVFDVTARNLRLAHFSPNFDRSGFALDLNVVYPIDRLNELAARKVIGSVASKHISFMGAQLDHTLSTMRLDTGPAAARVLRDDGVDVVLLTPV
jgi:D-proline reductase (dithiol) PrdB